MHSAHPPHPKHQRHKEAKINLQHTHASNKTKQKHKIPITSTKQLQQTLQNQTHKTTNSTHNTTQKKSANKKSKKKGDSTFDRETPSLSNKYTGTAPLEVSLTFLCYQACRYAC